MEYKYHLIALIIVIFLICIIYPPSRSKDCDDLSGVDESQNQEYVETPETQETENFDPVNIPSQENIRLMAELCATQLAEATYSNVIFPCVQISNANEISKCIVGFTQYYDVVIKDPIIDMYNNLKNLEGSYYDYNTYVNSKEEYAFMVEMSGAYSRALSLTIKNIEQNFGFDGFNNQTFIQVMKMFLVKLLSDSVVNLYTNVSSRAELENTIPESNAEEIMHYVENHNEAVNAHNKHNQEGEVVHHNIMDEIRQEIKNTIESEHLVHKPYAETSEESSENSFEMKQFSRPRSNDVLYLDCDDIKNNKVKVYIDGLRLGCKSSNN